MADVDYFREQAVQCRRLAATLSNRLAQITLREMADEYELKAAAPTPRQGGNILAFFPMARRKP